MAAHQIRIVGDPVLRQRAAEIEEIDGKLARLAEEMVVTMYEAPGVGLAAPQIGVRKRLFVYDVGEGPDVVINPEIVETDGEIASDEGCLSVPGLSWDVVRAKRVHLVGRDLQGDEISIEADNLMARCFQHEVDHLDGVLLLERLDPDTRKQALRAIRERGIGAAGEARPGAPSGDGRRAGGGFSLR